MQSLFEFRVSYQKNESSCLLLIFSCSFCLSNFYPSNFAERIYNFISAQFWPMGNESQTHVHSEVLLNFPIGRESKRINSFLSHGKIIETPKNNLKKSKKLRASIIDLVGACLSPSSKTATIMVFLGAFYETVLSFPLKQSASSLLNLGEKFCIATVKSRSNLN